MRLTQALITTMVLKLYAATKSSAPPHDAIARAGAKLGAPSHESPHSIPFNRIAAADPPRRSGSYASFEAAHKLRPSGSEARAKPCRASTNPSRPIAMSETPIAHSVQRDRNWPIALMPAPVLLPLRA